MIKKIYRVIDIYIIIDIPEKNLDDMWRLFDISNDIQEIDANEVECAFYFKILCFRKINQDIKIAQIESLNHIVKADEQIMLVNSDYTCAYVQTAAKETYNAFLNHLFYTHSIRKKVIQLHCSIISDKGKGIIFLGPSGVGKTTQAEQWHKYRQSQIINGDIGYVQRTESGFIAWGTPWHGSSEYCLNENVPLKALVVLKKAKTNNLRRLKEFEMITEVSGNVFYPTWLDEGIEICSAILNDLLKSVPVYRLDNCADKEAVEMLARELELC